MDLNSHHKATTKIKLNYFCLLPFSCVYFNNFVHSCFASLKIKRAKEYAYYCILLVMLFVPSYFAL